jgi:hypothetical protein
VELNSCEHASSVDLSALMTTETPPGERPTVAKVRAIVAAEHWAMMPQRCS